VLRLAAGRHLPAPRAALQWLPVIGVDIAAIFLLQIFQVGSLNYTALLAIPVLISSALGGLMLAFGTTASITLLTLAYTFWQYHGGLNDGAQSYYQTAFSCAGYFCVAYLTHELAKRVRRERSQALFNRLRTQTQEQVNSLVINHFSDGVLVVDSSLLVLQANPAALQLLGLPIDHPSLFPCRPTAGGSRWRIQHKPALPMPARCPPRFTCRPMNDTAPRACMCAHASPKFRRPIWTRVRRRKPATRFASCFFTTCAKWKRSCAPKSWPPWAVCRLPWPMKYATRWPPSPRPMRCWPKTWRASPAPNSYAGSWGRTPTDWPASPKKSSTWRVQQGAETHQGQSLPLDTLLAQISHEWRTQAAPPRQLLLRLNATARHILFDEEHLRRVLINLLDNAQRHRSHAGNEAGLQLISGHGPLNGQIQGLAPQDDTCWFMVWSDGAPLESSVERHLFEPFFSSQSRSSGLGLYICRELCQRYDASISYQRLARNTPQGDVNGNAFIVTLRSGPSSLASHSLFDSIMV
jgi:two-component system sensor histidine kinase PilS (NtrC family)